MVNLGIRAHRIVAFSAFLAAFGFPSLSFSQPVMELSGAVVVTLPDDSRQEEKAVQMLVEEVEKRTGIRWNTAETLTTGPAPAILVGKFDELKRRFIDRSQQLWQRVNPGMPEGYHIWVEESGGAPLIFIAGNDARGVLYGVGRFLRMARMTGHSIQLPRTINLSGSPQYPLRGHQLGYRPKTNSYDGWTVAMWEQYIRDLAVFGTNAIELIPPRSDDDDQSPHFPLPKMDMMVEMSRICDDYGLDVWIWYPALDEDYSDPKTVRFALEEWGEVFRQLPRIDAVLVPCGDPGDTPPEFLLPMLEKQASSLRLHHPEAQMWVAPQGFDQDRLERFLALIEQEPQWLSGIVYGPQTRIPMRELRDLIPDRYPIRHYPDITHSRHCQFPVPDWDRAFAVTQGREVINPRPVGHARIFQHMQPFTFGFITYSEGCNDDVNKIVWSALGWDADQDVRDVLREYSRYFIGVEVEEDFTQGLLKLEQNWTGPVESNQQVPVTLQQFQSMERSASPERLSNWRFQMALYRAYYDAYVRERHVYETALENQALGILRRADQMGAQDAMRRAEEILNRAVSEGTSHDLRTRIFELADSLFESVKMQLSVSKYQAIAVHRGANLDRVDFPLNNRLWLIHRFNEIRDLPHGSNRLEMIDEIVNWTNPGPGGFYDDLGNAGMQPHLLAGKGWEYDPMFFETPLTLFGTNSSLPAIENPPYSPKSWWDDAAALYDLPLQMRYTGLETGASYSVRVVYAGSPVRLTADGMTEVHSYLDRTYERLEFEIPAATTRDGELLLSWDGPKGRGGTGRGTQVAEVWLIKNP